MKPFGRWRVDWFHGYRWRAESPATSSAWTAAGSSDRQHHSERTKITNRHFTEQRRGVELGAELTHPSGEELAPRPTRSGSGTGTVASGGAPRTSRRAGMRATATSMAASPWRREKAQTSSAPSPSARNGPDLGAVPPAEDAACIACVGIVAGHRRFPLREAARLGLIRKRRSERLVT